MEAAVGTEVTARAVEEALREMRVLRDEGATEAETAAARDFLRGTLPLELQTTEQFSSRLADLVIFGLPDDYFEQYRERIAAVTPDDVRRVAREHLRLDRLAIVVVGDAERIAPDFESLGIGPVEIHKSH